MRKMALAAGLLLLSSASAFALAEMPDRTGKLDAGFHVGGLLPDSSNLNSAVYYGGTVAYGVTDYFAVGMEGGYGDSRTSFNVNGVSHNAHITRIPLFLDLIYRYTKKQENGYVPYGVLGLGALFSDIHGTGTLLSANQKLDMDNSFACKLGLGVDWYISNQWMLNLDLGYILVDGEAKVKNLANNNTLDSADMNYWMITGGAKYLFD